MLLHTYVGCAPFDVFYGRVSNFETNQQIESNDGAEPDQANVGLRIKKSFHNYITYPVNVKILVGVR